MSEEDVDCETAKELVKVCDAICPLDLESPLTSKGFEVSHQTRTVSCQPVHRRGYNHEDDEKSFGRYTNKLICPRR